MQTLGKKVENACARNPIYTRYKNRYGTPNFWDRDDDFKAQHSQFSMFIRIGPKCNVAPVLKILRVPGLPPGGSLGTVPKIWLAVPIVLASVNGLRVCRLTCYRT